MRALSVTRRHFLVGTILFLSFGLWLLSIYLGYWLFSWKTLFGEFAPWMIERAWFTTNATWVFLLIMSLDRLDISYMKISSDLWRLDFMMYGGFAGFFFFLQIIAIDLLT